LSYHQQADFGEINLTLFRYPKNQHDKSLQAWDSADELLAAQFYSQTLENKRVLIFNDTFAALSCFFVAAGAKVISCSDSKLCQLALEQNLAVNQLPTEAIKFVSSIELLTESADIILVKIPRTLAYLEYQLWQISQLATTDTKIIAGAKTKDIHNSTLALFERYIGDTKTSLAKKKSRLIHSTLRTNSKTQPAIKSWLLDTGGASHNFKINNMANVFSQDKLDIGGRFLIENLPPNMDAKNVIDLGCGNGVVGLSVLAKAPSAMVTFVDESFMAVESAQQNVQLNLPKYSEQCEFITNNCLSGFRANNVDIVLCNPPFHQQNTITEHIAKQMFSDAKKVLKPGGELRIVANSHLPYPAILKRLFGSYQKVASNKKFVILSAFK
jgi:23S rRNA (guanine1835-N2)-methyltransferase